MIECPIRKKSSNVIYSADDESRFYLEVRTNKENKKWGGKTPAFLFDGNYPSKGKYTRVVYGVNDYIEKVGTFGIYSTQNIPLHRVEGKPYVSLARLLHSLYTGISLEDAQALNVCLVDNGEVIIDGLTDPEEVEFVRTHFVYNFTRGNIISDIHGAELHSTSHIRVEYPAIVIECAGRRFYTDYNQGLLSLLRRVPNWNCSVGALRTTVVKEDRDKEDRDNRPLYVPLSAIVVAYHQGLVPDKENIRDVLRGIHANTSKKGIVIDHLTEQTENNFMAFLAPSFQSVNGALGNRRTRIKRPLFYYSVFDHAQKKCFVWCGDENVGWEKYVAFDDLTIEKNYKDYIRFFYFFWDTIVKPAGCAMDEPGEDSAAYYWSAPERIADKANPYNKLLSAPADRYDRYQEGIFADVVDLDVISAYLKEVKEEQAKKEKGKE